MESPATRVLAVQRYVHGVQIHLHGVLRVQVGQDWQVHRVPVARVPGVVMNAQIHSGIRLIPPTCHLNLDLGCPPHQIHHLPSQRDGTDPREDADLVCGVFRVLEAVEGRVEPGAGSEAISHRVDGVVPGCEDRGAVSQTPFHRDGYR